MSRSAYHIEEIAPGRFLLHDSRIAALVRSEGTIDGRIFALTSWRREGLLARLRQRLIRVLTLDDQLAALPSLPDAAPLGGELRRALAGGERISHFDAAGPAWVPVPAADTPNTVLLREGEAIRRRKGRGVPAYAQVRRDSGGVSLQTIGENTALMLSYAQANGITVPLEAQGDGFVLPELPLPAAYATLLRRLATPAADKRWLIESNALPLVQDLLRRLKITVEVQKGD